MKLKTRIISAFAGLSLFASSAIASQSIFTDNAYKFNKQASVSSQTTEPLKANLATIGQINYNNTFANNYSTSLSMGINRTSSNWTNFMFSGSSSSCSISGYIGDSDDRRAQTSDGDVRVDWYLTPSNDEMANYYNSSFMIRKSFADPVKVKDNSEQIKSTKSVSGGYRFYEYQVYNESSNSWTTNTISGDGTYATTRYAANESVSVGLRLSQKSADVVSNLKISSSGGNTDSGTLTSNVSGLSKNDTSRGSYLIKSACYTFANQSFGRSDDKSDVYSGTTSAIDQNAISFTPITVADADKKLKASEYLTQYQSDIEKNISITLTNGYPGSVYDALTFNADDEAGTISATFAPKSVLENGVVVPYKGSAVTIELMNGIIPPPPVQFHNENTSELAIKVSLSVVIPGIILTVLLAVAIGIFEKQKAKYTPFEYEL